MQYPRSSQHEDEKHAALPMMVRARPMLREGLRVRLCGSKIVTCDGGNVNIIDMWDELSMPVKANIDTTGTPPTDSTVPPQGDKYLWVTADYRRCGNP